ncbi:DUF2309 domain-containing protein [Robiginitalea sp. IMCC44478]|uniref:DUF2309 domain-containing protein n=1 Tax=Robiginitalea sp. IMCC44478 TaxID=3459122 RepID=UPI004041C086
MMQQEISKSIREASKVVGKTWPLYSFVTSNPLTGYEKLPFEEAVKTARELMDARVFPETSLYRKAWDTGAIQKEELLRALKEKGMTQSPEFYLQEMETLKSTEKGAENQQLNRIMSKWLAAFMDEGLAEWEMPGKEKGFYNAWRQLAPYDGELGIKSLREIPGSSSEALEIALSGHSADEFTKIFSYQLAALPGWTGYINYRTETSTPWQQEYPISLEDYLAVRLWIARQFNIELLPITKDNERETQLAEIQYIWLKAWEKSWQNQLEQTLSQFTTAPSSDMADAEIADAQFAFCIDTRSELIRRHVEAAGNYETFGYAGFFGIAMDYKSPEDGFTRKSCPPIVSSAYTVAEQAQPNKAEMQKSFQRKFERKKFREYFLKRMKNMLPSSFGFVEGAGFFYGLSLMGRTLIPGFLSTVRSKNASSFEEACEPEINPANCNQDATLQISLEEKTAIVKSAFDLTGWRKFAPLVVFAGHGSHSANNPFGSSLDCGACAASPGRHNARMLAKLANLPEVRKSLATKHQLVIPESTLFIGAEHNTTTDEIVLFDSDIPDSFRSEVEKLKANLALAQQTATRERLGGNANSVAAAVKKANDWAETRPEWGLAKNAGFIVGPRELTKNTKLDGRCFLHSYNWEEDKTGKALEGIMQGPMVVTQWINNHYYFSTVDNDTFGGGSKITHNITGKFAVVQGNGGDLKSGLPLQSLLQTDDEYYHQPLRLSVVIQSPFSRINEILSRNENLKTLLDNEWIYLMVMDPLQDNRILKYNKNLEWASSETEKEGPKSPAHKKKSQQLEEVLS